MREKNARGFLLLLSGVLTLTTLPGFVAALFHARRDLGRAGTEKSSEGGFAGLSKHDEVTTPFEVTVEESEADPGLADEAGADVVAPSDPSPESKLVAKAIDVAEAPKKKHTVVSKTLVAVDSEYMAGEEDDSDTEEEPEPKKKTGDGEPVTAPVQTYVRLEFELPMGLKELRDGPLGPLPRFLAMLRSEFALAAKAPANRVALLDVRGAASDMALLLSTKQELFQAKEEVSQAVKEVMEVDDARSLKLIAAEDLAEHQLRSSLPAEVGGWAKTVGLAQIIAKFVDTTNATTPGGPPYTSNGTTTQSQVMAAEEHGSGSSALIESGAKVGGIVKQVIVDLELRPGRAGADPAADQLYEDIEADLKDPSSKLMRGPVGELVANGAEVRKGAAFLEPYDGKLRNTAQPGKYIISPTGLLPVLFLFLLNARGPRL